MNAFTLLDVVLSLVGIGAGTRGFRSQLPTA
jgi:hypothetical protein